MKALGFFEISGVTAAVTALDIMCKTANVEFVTWERKLGGRLVTIIVEGDISDVTQSLEAAAAQGIKKPVNYVAIARPHEEIVKLVELSASRMEKKREPQTTATEAPELIAGNKPEAKESTGAKNKSKAQAAKQEKEPKQPREPRQQKEPKQEQAGIQEEQALEGQDGNRKTDEI